MTKNFTPTKNNRQHEEANGPPKTIGLHEEANDFLKTFFKKSDINILKVFNIFIHIFFSYDFHNFKKLFFKQILL